MTQQEVIYNFMQSLDNTELSGRAALDEAIQASSNFQNFEEFKRKFFDDLDAAKNWQTFLVEKCGIILDNDDTGAISGSDAGGSTSKGAADILPSEGDAIYPEGSSFTVNGLTIYGIPPKENLTDDQQIVVQGLYSWWIRDSLALIEESYGFSYTKADTTNNRMKLKFVDDENENFLAYVSFDGSDGKEFESRVLCVNMAFFKDMDATNRHPKTDKGQGLDRTLVHELVHGLMSSNVNYFDDLPLFLAEGGSAELIHGLDDENRNRIISTIQNTDALKEIFTALGTESRSEVYDGGYIIMRYFAKQAASDTVFDYDTYQPTVLADSNDFAINYWDEVTMIGGQSATTIVNSGENVIINAQNDDDTIKNYSQEVVINAGGGSNVISNSGNNVTANGGDYLDDIINEGANVLVNSGDDDDIITNYGEKSVIKGESGNDLIKNNIFDYETLNSDNFLIETSDNSNLYTKSNAALLGGNYSTIVGGKGDDNLINQASEVQIFGEYGADSIENYGFNSTIYGGDGHDTILNNKDEIEVNSKAEKAKSGDKDIILVTGLESKLFGNKGDDLFLNLVDYAEIYGQNDRDTVRNAGKNVSISGGRGNDYVFNGEVVISEGESSTTTSGGAYSRIFLDAGNDSLENVANSISAEGGAGKDQFISSGDFSTLIGDAGNDNFTNYGDLTSIDGGNGNDFIYTSGNKVSISGGNGKDSIENEGSEVYMLVGKGKDSINNFGDRASILTDAGNDYIESSGNNSTIFGGNGRDSIKNYGNNVSISGGKGNDKLWGSENADIFFYSRGDGRDIIYNFDDADILQITGSFSASYSENKGEIALKVGSTSKAITLKDFTATSFNINGETYKISGNSLSK